MISLKIVSLFSEISMKKEKLRRSGRKRKRLEISSMIVLVE
jgi:hypothetical protein